MKYNKLVRDKIPEIITQKGEVAKWHIADDVEYWQKLKEKLQEEISEFLEAESIDELADVMEVIKAIQMVKKFDDEELSRMIVQKRELRGGFEKKIILDAL